MNRKECVYCSSPYFDTDTPHPDYCDKVCFLASCDDQDERFAENMRRKPGESMMGDETLVCCGSDNSCHTSSCYFMKVMYEA